jgi:hypothetical protein
MAEIDKDVFTGKLRGIFQQVIVHTNMNNGPDEMNKVVDHAIKQVNDLVDVPEAPTKTRMTTAEELLALPYYTPIRGYGRNGTITVLAYQSPNGSWWSTYANPADIEALLGVYPEGFEVLAAAV